MIYKRVGGKKDTRQDYVRIVRFTLYATFFFLPLCFVSDLAAQNSISSASDTLQIQPQVLPDSLTSHQPTTLIAPEVNSAPTTSVNVNTVLRSVPQSRFRRFCDSLSMTTVALSALLVPGTGQIINGDYWKVPFVTGSVAAFTYASIHFHQRYTQLRLEPLSLTSSARLEAESHRIEMRSLRNASIVAAAVSYSLGVADALISHSRDFKSPFAAVISSALLPGLGQMYTGTYWKVPIIYGTAIYLTSSFMRMDLLYRRFDKALTYLLDGDPNTIDEFEGKRSRQDIQYFRDYYRRYRDLNLLGLSLLYVLNVIDAYVGAHLYYWNVDSDLAMRIYPSVTPQVGAYSSGVLAMNFNLSF